MLFSQILKKTTMWSTSGIMLRFPQNSGNKPKMPWQKHVLEPREIFDKEI
jgi:hypothetical protein